MSRGNCFQCITHESMVLADLNSWKKVYWYEIGKAVVEKPWGWTELCQPSQRAFIFSFDFMNSEHSENGYYALNENSAARGNLRFGPWIHKEIFTWLLYMIRKSLHGQFQIQALLLNAQRSMTFKDFMHLFQLASWFTPAIGNKIFLIIWHSPVHCGVDQWKLHCILIAS